MGTKKITMNRRNFLGITAGAVACTINLPDFIGGAMIKSGRSKLDSHRLTPVPPLGWNCYDCLGSGDEQSLMENLEVFAKRLKPHGYKYFVVDNLWSNDIDENGKQFVQLDEYGREMPSKKKYPNGFVPLIKRTHELGLKFGFWMGRGIIREAVNKNLPVKGTLYRAQDIANKEDISTWYKLNYGVDMRKPGAQEFYNSVVELLAGWGADFIKYDDIVPHPDEIEAVANAIEHCGRDIVLSLSPGDIIDPAHIKSYRRANMLRITGDVWDKRESLEKGFVRWEQMAQYGGEGFWIDLDMIPFGYFTNKKRMDKFTIDQKQTFMAQRALAASPLFMGGDLRTSDGLSFELITNPGMLACNQNGIVGKLVQRKGSIDVWKTPDKKKNDRGWIGVFNRSESLVNIKLNELDLGISNDKKWKLFEVWKNTPIEKSTYAEFNIGADGVVFLRYQLA